MKGSWGERVLGARVLGLWGIMKRGELQIMIELDLSSNLASSSCAAIIDWMQDCSMVSEFMLNEIYSAMIPATVKPC